MVKVTNNCRWQGFHAISGGVSTHSGSLDIIMVDNVRPVLAVPHQCTKWLRIFTSLQCNK